MAVLIPSGYGLIAHHHTLVGDDRPIVTTHGIVGPGAETPDAVCQAVSDAWDAEVMPVIGAGYEHVLTEVRFGPGPDYLVAQTVASTVGGSSGLTLPQNCAMLVQKRSGLGGRRNRGRMYWPPPAEAEVDVAGVVTPTATTAYQTAADDYMAALVAAFGSDVGQMVILHDESLGISTVTVVTDLVVSNIIATQRRRLRR